MNLNVLTDSVLPISIVETTNIEKLLQTIPIEPLIKPFTDQLTPKDAQSACLVSKSFLRIFGDKRVWGIYYINLGLNLINFEINKPNSDLLTDYYNPKIKLRSFCMKLLLIAEFSPIHKFVIDFLEEHMNTTLSSELSVIFTYT
jgi:hypothetical protein